MFAHAASLTKRPTYGTAGNGRVVVGGDFSAPIGHLRSWQHKESRRATLTNLRRLTTCAALQIAGGFFTTFTDYSATVFCEDIGLAGLEYTVRVAEIRKETREVCKLLPIGEAGLSRLLRLHGEMIEIIAVCKRSRIVPEAAAIALLKQPQRPDFTPGGRSLTDVINECRVLAASCHGIPLTSPALSRAVSAATEAILADLDVWALIGYGDSPIIKSLRAMAKTPGASETLCIHLAVWVACLRRENTPQKVTNRPLASTVAEHVMPQPWSIPEYAYDKHTGHAGGYAQFYREGIRVEAYRLEFPETDTQFRELALSLRDEYEEKNGAGSSKGRKIVARLRAGAVAAAAGKPKAAKKARKATDSDETKEERAAAPAASAAAAAAAEGPPLRLQGPVPKRAKAVLPYPIFQPITGRGKKMVYLKHPYVLKGPYKPDEERLIRNFTAHAKIVAIDRARFVSDTTLAAPELIYLPEGLFLRWHYEGVAIRGQDISAVENEVMERTLVIARSTGSKRVSDLTDTERKESPRVIYDTLQHLYSRALAGVGDAGLFNILALRGPFAGHANGAPYTGAKGIDLEDVRGNYDMQSDDPLRLLCPRPTGIDGALTPHLSCIKRLKEQDAVRLLDARGLEVWRRLEQLLPPLTSQPPPAASQ